MSYDLHRSRLLSILSLMDEDLVRYEGRPNAKPAYIRQRRKEIEAIAAALDGMDQAIMEEREIWGRAKAIAYQNGLVAGRRESEPPQQWHNLSPDQKHRLRILHNARQRDKWEDHY